MRVKVRNEDTLDKVIADMTARAPFERDGFIWAVATQDVFCERLGGWSKSKFQRATGTLPFIREVAKIDGSVKTLLRKGEPGVTTSAKLAKQMSKLLRSYRERCRKALLKERDALVAAMSGVPEADAQAEVRIDKIDHLLTVVPELTTPKEFGCMCGLAETWPDGYQIEIFKLVLADWPAYMAGQKLEVWQSENDREKFFEFASVDVVRKYHGAGLELYVMDRQDKATELTPELRKLSLSIQK